MVFGVFARFENIIFKPSLMTRLLISVVLCCGHRSSTRTSSPTSLSAVSERDGEDSDPDSQNGSGMSILVALEMIFRSSQPLITPRHRFAFLSTCTDDNEATTDTSSLAWIFTADSGEVKRKFAHNVTAANVLKLFTGYDPASSKLPPPCLPNSAISWSPWFSNGAGPVPATWQTDIVAVFVHGSDAVKTRVSSAAHPSADSTTEDAKIEYLTAADLFHALFDPPLAAERPFTHPPLSKSASSAALSAFRSASGGAASSASPSNVPPLDFSFLTPPPVPPLSTVQSVSKLADPPPGNAKPARIFTFGADATQRLTAAASKKSNSSLGSADDNVSLAWAAQLSLRKFPVGMLQRFPPPGFMPSTPATSAPLASAPAAVKGKPSSGSNHRGPTPPGIAAIVSAAASLAPHPTSSFAPSSSSSSLSTLLPSSAALAQPVPHMTIVRVQWTPHRTFVDQRRNHRPMRDARSANAPLTALHVDTCSDSSPASESSRTSTLKSPLSSSAWHRCATYDGAPSLSELRKLPTTASHRNARFAHACAKVAAHIQRSMPPSVVLRSITAYFVADAADRMWLWFAHRVLMQTRAELDAFCDRMLRTPIDHRSLTPNEWASHISVPALICYDCGKRVARSAAHSHTKLSVAAESVQPSISSSPLKKPAAQFDRRALTVCSPVATSAAVKNAHSDMSRQSPTASDASETSPLESYLLQSANQLNLPAPAIASQRKSGEPVSCTAIVADPFDAKSVSHCSDSTSSDLNSNPQSDSVSDSDSDSNSGSESESNNVSDSDASSMRTSTLDAAESSGSDSACMSLLELEMGRTDRDHDASARLAMAAVSDAIRVLSNTASDDIVANQLLRSATMEGRMHDINSRLKTVSENDEIIKSICPSESESASASAAYSSDSSSGHVANVDLVEPIIALTDTPIAMFNRAASRVDPLLDEHDVWHGPAVVSASTGAVWVSLRPDSIAAGPNSLPHTPTNETTRDESVANPDQVDLPFADHHSATPAATRTPPPVFLDSTRAVLSSAASLCAVSTPSAVESVLESLRTEQARLESMLADVKRRKAEAAATEAVTVAATRLALDDASAFRASMGMPASAPKGTGLASGRSANHGGGSARKAPSLAASSSASALSSPGSARGRPKLAASMRPWYSSSSGENISPPPLDATLKSARSGTSTPASHSLSSPYVRTHSHPNGHLSMLPLSPFAEQHYGIALPRSRGSSLAAASRISVSHSTHPAFSSTHTVAHA